MKYDLHMSMILNQDIYIQDNQYYLQYGTNHHRIGSTGMPVVELRLNMNTFLGA